MSYRFKAICLKNDSKLSFVDLDKTIYMEFLKELKTELLHDPAILLLGIYPKKMKTLIWKDIWTLMLRAALFTIASSWKQPKCLSTDEWIKNIWHVCVCVCVCVCVKWTGILLIHKKEWNNATCGNKDGPGYYQLSEVSQRQIS